MADDLAGDRVTRNLLALPRLLRRAGIQLNADNTRLYLSPTSFNRFAVTREINDGFLAPRFSPSTQAWVLSGIRVPVNPAVPASAGRDADDR